jgi:hypothetical protein
MMGGGCRLLSNGLYGGNHSGKSATDLLMSIVDIVIPMSSGNTKHSSLRKPALPDDAEAATSGKINEASMEITQIPALLLRRRFFEVGVIVVAHAQGVEEL